MIHINYNQKVYLKNCHIKLPATNNSLYKGHKLIIFNSNHSSFLLSKHGAIIDNEKLFDDLYKHMEVVLNGINSGWFDFPLEINLYGCLLDRFKPWGNHEESFIDMTRPEFEAHAWEIK